MKHILALLLSVILFSAKAETPSFMNKSPEEGLWEALETVFKDGKLLKDYTLAEIRERIDGGL